MSDIQYPKDLKVGTYSDQQVMKSAAGYYVGTFYMDQLYAGSEPFLCPGSRDSGYFATYEEASAFLSYLNGEAHA
jgi:hypothetical protein